jgi:hypothetical protein
MTLVEFKTTLENAAPPSVAPALVALWHDARGDWDMAHKVAQDVNDRNGAWVHAYLHRKEGDIGNARYWYGEAQRPAATDSLEAEWERIAGELLAGGAGKAGGAG